MNAAIWGLIGTIVGAGIALLGTWLTIKKDKDIETRKLKLQLLVEKKELLEDIMSNITAEFFDNPKDNRIQIEDYFVSCTTLTTLKRHYFLDSHDMVDLIVEHSQIINDELNHKDNILLKWDWIIKFTGFVTFELEKTMKEINKLTL